MQTLSGDSGLTASFFKTSAHARQAGTRPEAGADLLNEITLRTSYRSRTI